MKKLSIIFALLLFGFSNAQFLKYGVTGSIHKSSMKGIHGVGNPSWGGNIGVFADIALVPNDIYDSAWLYFSPQLEIYNVGETGDWDEDDKNIQRYSNIYVGIPLYIKYFLRNNGYKGDLYFMLGPKIEFLASEKTKEGNAVNEAIAGGFDPNAFGLGQKINSIGYGASLKIGAKVTDAVDVFIRYDRGFSKVYPDYTKHATFNQFLALGVSYYIGETN